MNVPASQPDALTETEIPATPEVLAAGAVLWRHGTAGPEVAVVHRPRYDDWSLPKGKLDPGELAAHAAAREIQEETGFSCALSRKLTEVRYEVPAPAGGTAPKRVTYYSAQATGGEFAPNGEVDALRWIPPAQAREMLSYELDASVLDAFERLPVDVRTLLLVRHAEAGTRAAFGGQDEHRPLSATGAEQRAALHRLLPLFGPARVYAAPRTRCEQTVSPVAEELRTELHRETVLSEEGYRNNPTAGMQRLLDIVDEPGVAVVCSQGGVIPDLVARLAGSSGLGLHEVPCAKGSVWTLTFQDGTSRSPQLVAADYLDDARA
jgi:8-oxo-dGTP diphosphatase